MVISFGFLLCSPCFGTLSIQIYRMKDDFVLLYNCRSLISEGLGFGKIKGIMGINYI